MEMLGQLYMVSIGFNLGLSFLYLMLGGKWDLFKKALPGMIILAPLVMLMTLAQLFPMGKK